MVGDSTGRGSPIVLGGAARYVRAVIANSAWESIEAGVPHARTVLAIPASQVAAVRRTVQLLFRIAHSRAYQEWVDAEEVGETARWDPGSFGAFMGYDFHVTPSGPRLIEINTNAGGVLVNGFRSVAICAAARFDWLCCDPPPAADVEQKIMDVFRAEMTAAGFRRPLQSVAIADERPTEQFLYPEFLLFADLLARYGIRARVCDTRELRRLSHGRIGLPGEPIDLVYWRDCDFRLASPRAATLREAYLKGQVVLTPSPREHHLLADKRRLQILSSFDLLRSLGVTREDASFLASVVPETRPLRLFPVEEAWGTRASWVFKPAAAFGSKGVFRGDKVSKRRLEEIYAHADNFVAQRRVEPASVAVETALGTRQMKFDIRAYAYRDEVLFLGARVYEGQVTNFRTPGGGFAAIGIAAEGTVSALGAGVRVGRDG